MSELFIGLMSGTSLDAIDAALVAFDGESPTLIAHHRAELTPEERQQLSALTQAGTDELQTLGRLDVELGRRFAGAVQQLLESAGLSPAEIRGIGSHGQTVRHHPHGPAPFTLQIGDPNIIAQNTGITTVADFRRRDMAAGGQGAPLVPAFHAAVFRSSVEDRAVLNIGGIANFTLLPAGGQVSGFDTGPGNALLDAWIEHHQGQALDRNGAWAASGTPSQSLLKALMADPYFQLNPPKSTGREYFHLGWLTSHLAGFERLAPEDVQATLLQLTAHSICMALKTVQPSTRRVLVCGGGVHNRALMRALQGRMPKIMWSPTDEFGLDADWVEAVAFAWLARRTLQGLHGNLPAVTGAREAVILGGIYPAGPG